MTVIAAALTKHGVIMAADAQISAGWQKQMHETPKLWVTEQLAMGASGTVRTAQVLKHYVKWPRFRAAEDTDLEKWAVVSLVPAIKQAARENGALEVENGLESYKASLLLSVNDKIMEINSDGSVVIEPCGRMAIGSGYAEALGVLGDEGPWTQIQVIEAVRRATITARGCSGPITVVNARKLTVKQVVFEEGTA